MKSESIQDRVLAMHEEGFSPREMMKAFEDEEIFTTYGTIYSYHSKFKLKPHTTPVYCPHCGKNIKKEIEEKI